MILGTPKKYSLEYPSKSIANNLRLKIKELNDNSNTILFNNLIWDSMYKLVRNSLIEKL